MIRDKMFTVIILSTTEINKISKSLDSIERDEARENLEKIRIKLTDCRTIVYFLNKYISGNINYMELMEKLEGADIDLDN